MTAKIPDSPTPTFTVVVPTLNEEASIADCIAGVRRAGHGGLVIVADGGSLDRTVEVAAAQGAVVRHARPGRGAQCNAGAGATSAAVLVFLHADSHLPEGAFEMLARVFSNPGVEIGTFRLAFDRRHWVLQTGCLLSRLDRGLFRFGDQCIVVRKSLFVALGGFRQWRLFEDLDFTRRARQRTKMHRFPMTVTTSARRFVRNGVVRQQMRDAWYTLQYMLHVPPEMIARRYYAGDSAGPVAVIIMARYPTPGEVKSRLSESVGTAAAAGIYRVCTDGLLGEARSLPTGVRRYVSHTGADEAAFREWVGPGFAFLKQPEGDLGARLEQALQTAFGDGAQRVVCLAGDVPDLTALMIAQAVDALQTADVVIGPTEDGGYYLIGMKQPHAELFRDIAWGTDAVYRQTVAAANALGLSVRSLEPLRDIDTIEDLRGWLKTISEDINSQAQAIRSLLPGPTARRGRR